MKAEINIGIDTSQTRLDIYVRPSGEYFSVENTHKGVQDAVRRIRPYHPDRVLIEATGRLEMHFVCAAHKAGYQGTVYLFRVIAWMVNPRAVKSKIGKLSPNSQSYALRGGWGVPAEYVVNTWIACLPQVVLTCSPKLLSRLD